MDRIAWALMAAFVISFLLTIYILIPLGIPKPAALLICFIIAGAVAAFILFWEGLFGNGDME
jgi:hypothetical protein